MVNYMITVISSNSRSTWIELYIYFRDSMNTDVLREISISRSKKHRGAIRSPCVECYYLPRGMNTRIGASRAMNLDLFSGEFQEGCFESALDGGLCWLDLPSMVAGTIVG